MYIGRRIASALVVLAAMVLIFIGIQKQEFAKEKLYTQDLFAMNTYFTLKAYGSGGPEALSQCTARVQELEKKLSVTDEDSDIRKINQGQSHSVDKDTLYLIQEALKLCEETEGALDITLYPVLREWGFTTNGYQVPQAKKIAELLEKVDYQKVELLFPDGLICLEEGMELELGAVAKGYTGDCLMEILRQQGITSAMVDLGGNVQVLGHKPDGSQWKVAVRNPFDRASELGVLEINDKAVITSGSYERYFEEEGQRYWHILDPADGYPADSGLVSVTVVGEKGIRCDGLSTALFVMGREKAEAFWRQAEDFEMILVTEEGQLYITEGLQDCFTCGEGWQAEVID